MSVGKANLRKILALLLFATVIFFLIKNAHAQVLGVAIDTDKDVYNIGEEAHLYGNVTLGGLIWPQPRLVAVEVDTPSGSSVILRTIPTAPISDVFETGIVSVTPCDLQGNPKSSFRRGTIAYFKITLNNSGASKYLEILLNIFDSTNIPFEAFTPFVGWIHPGQTELLVPVPIPRDIALGTAMLYSSAVTALPKHGGYPCCPEKSASFSVQSASSTASTTGHIQACMDTEQVDGEYSLTFRIDNYETTRRFPTGNYTAYATTEYEDVVASATKSFQVVLIGDVNGDKEVNILDAILLALAFNSRPGDHNWDPRADLNGDNEVNILDAILLAKNFGKRAA